MVRIDDVALAERYRSVVQQSLTVQVFITLTAHIAGTELSWRDTLLSMFNTS